MALENWVDKQDGIDDILAEDINSIANGVIETQKEIDKAVAIEQKRSDNTFANALKSSKSGSAILIDDISPVTHEMGVKVRSKNLIPYPYYNFSLEQNGITATLGNDGSIALNGTATENVAFKIYDNTYDTKRDFVVKSGVEYTVSGIPSGAASNTYYLRITTMNSRAHDFYDNSLAQFYITEDTAVKWVFVAVKPGATVNNLVFKPQIEEGTTSTAYTPYVPDLTAVKVIKSNASGEDVAEYTPNADGTVNGVTSLYPNTTLTTDTDGVLIDCVYNRDINKAFAALEAAIATNNS